MGLNAEWWTAAAQFGQNDANNYTWWPRAVSDELDRKSDEIQGNFTVSSTFGYSEARL